MYQDIHWEKKGKVKCLVLSDLFGPSSLLPFSLLPFSSTVNYKHLFRKEKRRNVWFQPWTVNKNFLKTGVKMEYWYKLISLGQDHHCSPVEQYNTAIQTNAPGFFICAWDGMWIEKFIYYYICLTNLYCSNAIETFIHFLLCCLMQTKVYFVPCAFLKEKTESPL